MHNSTTTLIKLLKDEDGATAIEYGLIAALISIAALRAYPGRRPLRDGEGFFGLCRKDGASMLSHRGKGLTHPGRKRPARPTQRLPG